MTLDVQLGFRRNCSTKQALKDLLDDNTFCLLNRCKLFMKLEQMTGTDYPMTARIRYVLQYNVVKLSDSVTESGYIL